MAATDQGNGSVTGQFQPIVATSNPTSTQQSMYGPPPGQTPLADLPQYGGAGGSNQAAQYYAGQQFAKLFGRNPTQSELDQLSTSYMSGDPNVANVAGGNSAIAAYYNQISNSPTNIANQQQQQALGAYNQNQTKYDGQTNQIFQQMLGRNASSAEASHFGSLLASGQIDAYGMQNLVGQTQEYQNIQTQNYQNQLSNNLQQTQSNYYNQYIMPSIQSQFASQGRDVNSSGFANSLAQAAKQQNYDLQNYLAQFGAGQYGQAAQNQQGVYQQYLGNLYGLQNADISNQLQQQNYQQQQATNYNNYVMQQNAYSNYLRNYGNRNNGMGGLIGGLAGAGLGAFGGPAGAAAGWQIGSGIGGAFGGGSYNQGSSNPFSYAGLGTSWGGRGSSGGPPAGQI